MAESDYLTGLSTRAAFDAALREYCGHATTARPVALIMVDVDYFKRVNDTHGHPAGDEVLRTAASIISAIVHGKGTAYRYGGEEFAILLPQTDIVGAEALAERLREAVESRAMAEAHDSPVTVTSSFGVAECASHDLGPPVMPVQPGLPHDDADHARRLSDV